MKDDQIKWKSERQLRGVQANVQAALNRCRNGAYVTIDCTTARAIVEALKQARHTEKNHEPPAPDRT